jgi:hypothetical protein
MNGKRILKSESNYNKKETLKENENKKLLSNFFNKIRNHLKT